MLKLTAHPKHGGSHDQGEAGIDCDAIADPGRCAFGAPAATGCDLLTR
jgi:hypothetical protein